MPAKDRIALNRELIKPVPLLNGTLERVAGTKTSSRYPPKECVTYFDILSSRDCNWSAAHTVSDPSYWLYRQHRMKASGAVIEPRCTIVDGAILRDVGATTRELRIPIR